MIAQRELQFTDRQEGFTPVRSIPGRERAAMLGKLKAAGVPTAVYYPKPLHQQTAYRHYPSQGGKLPVSEKVATEVFSLPMHPYLDEKTQGYIIDSVQSLVS